MIAKLAQVASNISERWRTFNAKLPDPFHITGAEPAIHADTGALAIGLKSPLQNIRQTKTVMGAQFT